MCDGVGLMVKMLLDLLRRGGLKCTTFKIRDFEGPIKGCSVHPIKIGHIEKKLRIGSYSFSN